MAPTSLPTTPSSAPPATHAPAPPTDEHLVLATLRGHRPAFSQLVLRYERAALLTATAILRSPHDARDAVQDAFVTAYQQLRRLHSPHKFGPWLLRITRNQALVHRRKSATRLRLTTPLDDRDPHDPESASLTSLTDAADLIARLPPQECLVTSLRHLDDLPVAEIARLTGRPLGTVTKQLSRAYQRMRTWLEQGDRP